MLPDLRQPAQPRSDRTNMAGLLVFFILAFLPAPAAAEQDSIQEFRQAAIQAHGEKDYRSAIAAYAKLLAVQPDDTLALYNTACAHALLGNEAEAVRFLIAAAGGRGRCATGCG
jgi:hypothetical protein